VKLMVYSKWIIWLSELLPCLLGTESDLSCTNQQSQYFYAKRSKVTGSISAHKLCMSCCISAVRVFFWKLNPAIWKRLGICRWC